MSSLKAKFMDKPSSMPLKVMGETHGTPKEPKCSAKEPPKTQPLTSSTCNEHENIHHSILPTCMKKKNAWGQKHCYLDLKIEMETETETATALAMVRTPEQQPPILLISKTLSHSANVLH
jgi:hypothetical protein